jgi:hypothetical protein
MNNRRISWPDSAKVDKAIERIKRRRTAALLRAMRARSGPKSGLRPR